MDVVLVSLWNDDEAAFSPELTDEKTKLENDVVSHGQLFRSANCCDVIWSEDKHSEVRCL